MAGEHASNNRRRQPEAARGDSNELGCCERRPFACMPLGGHVPGRCIIDATVLPMDSPDTTAEAICWNDAGQIVAVGDQSTVMAAAAELSIEPESLPGHTILPGFVDAHMHFLHVGVRKIRPELRDAPDLAGALQIVQAWLAANPGTDSVIAEGWDESLWPEGRFPSKQEVATLEEFGGRPVVMRRMCGHFAVAGPRALAIIRPHWDDPQLVNLDSGVLKEQPSLYLNEVMPVPGGALAVALDVATDMAFKLGVTTVGEYTQAPFREAFLAAAESGSLRIRIANHIYVQQLNDAIAAGFETGKQRGPLFRDGGLKVFHDGSFGGRTALLRQPYLDDPDNPDNRGTRVWTDDEVDGWYQDAHRAGIQVTAHVIGDAAVDQGLAGYERLRAACQDFAGDLPPWDNNRLRHRFEHYELPHDDAVAKTAELGIVACSQPNFVGEWSGAGGMYEQRIGDLYRLNNRLRTYLEAGVQLCFGSDGMPFGPLFGIESAMNHPQKGEQLTANESIWLYTNRAAWACHWDDQVGSLEAGKQADILVVAGDLAAPPTQWLIEQTILAGEAVATNETPLAHADMQ